MRIHHALRAASGAGAGSGPTPTNGLITHYTMDSISGSTLLDEQSNYDGTITGATQTTGKIGQALNFDGNDFVASGAVNEDIYAVSFWLYSDVEINASTSGQVPVDFDDGENDFQSNIALGSITTHAGSEVITILDGNTTNGGSVNNFGRTYTRANLSAGWRHIVINWTGSRYDIIVDDSIQTIYSGTGGAGHSRLFSTGVDSITLGRWNAVGGIMYLNNKKLDAFRIYDRSLTSDEITALYNEGA